MSRISAVPRFAAIWAPIVGLGLPAALILTDSLLTPPAWVWAFGISAKLWLLFGCAPVTSLCLAACTLMMKRAAPDAHDTSIDP